MEDKQVGLSRGLRKGARPVRPLAALKLSTLIQKSVAEGISPLQYMLDVVRSPEPQQFDGESMRDYSIRLMQFTMLRLSAARYAAPYVHQRIATTVNVNTDSKSEKPIDILELAKSVAFVLATAEHAQQTIDMSQSMQ